MTHRIDEIQTDGDHLHIRIEGTFSREVAAAWFADVMARYDPERHQGLLLDVSGVVMTTSDVDHYGYVEALIAMGYRRIGRIAYLGDPDHRESDDFFETAARNRGLMVKFFYGDPAPAAAWLAELGRMGD